MIVETEALKVLFLVSLLALAYTWMHAPQRTSLLYLAAFILGAGVTSYRQLGLLLIPLAMCLLVTDWRLFRDFAIPGSVFAVAMWLRLIGVLPYISVFRLPAESTTSNRQTASRKGLLQVFSCDHEPSAQRLSTPHGRSSPPAGDLSAQR